MRLDLYAEGGYSGGGITENGGNISGPLLLAGNPSQTLEAVPKQYVDAYYNSINAGNLTAGTLPAARLPNFTGDLQSSPGTTQLTLNNSGIVPGEYSKVTVNSKGIVTAGSNISNSDIPFGLNWSKINAATLPSTLSSYGITNGVNVGGATMLGFLTISQSPTLGTHIATKQYVDSLISSGGIAVGDILRKPYSTTPAGFLKCNGAEVDKTTYADLYSVIGDQYTDNATIGNGKPWQFQYQINETQNNNITDWATATALPSASGYNCSIATKNRVYLFVGWNGTAYTSTVYTAPINADGTLGSWSATTSLPGVLGGSQAIVTKNRVYLLGGYNGSTWSSTVYTAPINSDGTLGTWTTGTSLPSGFSDSQAIVTKNRVYIFGGWNGTSQISNVYTATISSDGFIDNWTSTTPLTLGVMLASVCAIKNKVYIFGGYIIGNGSQSTVYSAPINIDGTLGLWSAENSLPVKFSHSQVYVTKNRVYLLGGYNNSAYTTNVYTAPINADGSIGTWVIGSPMSSITLHGSVIATLNNIYYFGGYTGSGWISTVQFAAINGGLNDYSSYYSQDSNNYLMSGSGHPWRQQYQINTSQSNDITGWTTGTALPGGLTYSQAVVTKNRVYLFGGNTASNVWSSTVYTAPINSDGTLGTWTTSNSIPLACSAHSVIVTKNRLYLLGGQTSSNSATSNIYTSVINADGTIGNWVSSGNLPTNLAFFSSFISKNNIYIVGGWNGSTAVSTVYRASINTDGTLGGWVSAPSLPAIVNNSQIAVTNNRVYLLGGYNNTSTVSSVYTATINNEGLISNWSVSSSLVTAAHASQIVCTRNKLYLFGGYNTGSGELSTVQTATINSDGTLNAWTTGTSLPVTISSSQAIVVNNRIYLLSNWNNGGVNGVVYTANISSNIQDYSPYYDGTIQYLQPIYQYSKFLLPDLSADEPFGSYSYIKY